MPRVFATYSVLAGMVLAFLLSAPMLMNLFPAPSATIGLASAEEGAPFISITPAPPEMLTAPTGSEEHPQRERIRIPEFIDLLHGELSHEILSTAIWLDSYFGDERYLLEQNRSYFRIRYDVFQEERASVLLQPAFDMRLVLPQLEKKAHIVLSAEPNELQKGAATPLTSTGERIGTTDERNVTAALHYLFRSTEGESFIVRTGLQFKQLQPVAFVAPRYRSLIPFGVWDFRFTQDTTYKTDTQWQAETTFDLERKLSRDFFFRTSLDGNWFANTAGYFATLSFSVRQAFTLTQALDYEWANSYQTRPVWELAEVAFRLRYRHSFWREWLFFEIGPQIRFPRGGNFDVLPGILFRFETYFGREGGF